ncbi:MAG TPA: TIGR04222 domain-containing membrane protein [Methylocystis sp.]|jgi:uncharacterized protein (TIGR04222 family)
MFNLPPAGILHLPGPQFLAFYGIVAVIVLLAAFLLMFFADTTGTDNLPSVPASPDPIEVAYLSDGVNAVLRTVVYDLRQLGLLTLDKDNRLVATGAAPTALTRMQRRVLDTVLDRPKIGKLFKDKSLRSSLEAILDPMRARLVADDLLQPEAVRRTRNWTLGLGLLILLGLAAAKIEIALSLGITKIQFLIFLAIFSSACLFWLVSFFSKRAASRRGRAYLEAMRLAYSSRAPAAVARITPAGSGGGGIAYDSALLLVALYGFDALKGTPDAAFAKAFAQSDGGYGSSCGGGGDGGGGGCGGCGGGGGD